MSKVDRYLIHAFDAATEKMNYEIKEGTRSSSDIIRLPMLIRVRDSFWNPSAIPDCTILARFGTLIACLGSVQTVEALRDDPAVLAIEASRPASSSENFQSLSFIKANLIHSGPFSEKGDQALIAIIDTDIDVLHKTFIDGSGDSTRILAVWDQTDPTGPSPKVGRFGTEYTAGQIDSFILRQSTPYGFKRITGGHGTHVASIAAGRSVQESQFPGGIAPEAKILFVIPSLQVGPTDPYSIGYSASLLAALAYIDDMAQRLDLPVVVNLSQGMNAGAHDGTSLIEAAFDEFTDGGRAPGRVVVKSAGNERKEGGHAYLNLGSNQSETLEWSSPRHRGPDVIELWFKACDEMRFRLCTPPGLSLPSNYSVGGGQRIRRYQGPATPRHVISSSAVGQQGSREYSSWIDRSNPTEDSQFSSGNSYHISYERYHRDNGDSCLTVSIAPDRSGAIGDGTWCLEIETGTINSSGDIHAWIERNNDKRIRFLNHVSEETTVTIPGTAKTVITVSSVAAATPFRVSSYSSYGPTRDGRNKPDLSAPGEDISAAQGNTFTDLKAESGTSMAAPHVTGAIALLFSYWSKQRSNIPDWEQLNAAQIRAALSQTTQNYNGHWNHGMGFGVLDVEKFLCSFD